MEEKEKQEGTASGLKIRSFVPQFVVFLYTIFLQWSIAYALVLVFFLDWFAVSYQLLAVLFTYDCNHLNEQYYAFLV